MKLLQVRPQDSIRDRIQGGSLDSDSPGPVDRRRSVRTPGRGARSRLPDGPARGGRGRGRGRADRRHPGRDPRLAGAAARLQLRCRGRALHRAAGPDRPGGERDRHRLPARGPAGRAPGLGAAFGAAGLRRAPRRALAPPAERDEQRRSRRGFAPAGPNLAGGERGRRRASRSHARRPAPRQRAHRPALDAPRRRGQAPAADRDAAAGRQLRALDRRDGLRLRDRAQPARAADAGARGPDRRGAVAHDRPRPPARRADPTQRCAARDDRLRSGAAVSWRFAIAAALLVAFPGQAFAEQESAAPGEAVFKVWNREIAVLRATRSGRDPEERARRAARILRSLPDAELAKGVTTTRVQAEGGEAFVYEVGGESVLVLLQGDADPESGETLARLAQRIEKRLDEAIQAYFEQSSLKRLTRAAGLALLATLVYAALVWVLVRGRNFAASRLVAASRRSLERASRAGFDLWHVGLRAIGWLVNAIAWITGGVATYVWLTSVLFQFPYTQPWGEALGGWLLDFVTTWVQAAVGAVPGLVAVVAILVIARALTRLVDQFFRSVQSGRVRPRWLRAETADATRRIVIMLLWVFALALAYPYIPGSHSSAFQGISVLVGVMISLGSASLVNNAMSGLVVVYSRAFRVGDFVRIGETEGVVLELSGLSTKLLTPGGEVTVPHGVTVAGSTVNYTRPAQGRGSLLSTSVTIGYDAPWRQVHALLLGAAAQTAGLRESPAPRVLQRALSDFYVAYQLVAHAEHAERSFEVLSELHQRIQDSFNEHGVQILSPHFAVQPREPVTVPRSAWFASPAAPPPDE